MKVLKLNWFQKILKKIGLLVIKEKIRVVTKVIEKQRDNTPLFFSHSTDDITYIIKSINLDSAEIVLEFNSDSHSKIGVYFSDFEYEKVAESTYKFKLK